MSNKLTAHKKTTAADLFAVLCPLIYFASYLTRKDYSIVMAAITETEGIAKSVAGIPESLALISYGAGQIISGVLGDKIKPHKMISIGLSATAILNTAMALCGEPTARAVIWFLNGFAQSMLWPPMVRILAATMEEKRYNDVCVNVNIAGISGTIFLYLTSSLIWIKFFTWKYTFFASAIICAAILTAWLVGCKKAFSDSDPFDKKTKEVNSSAEAKHPKLSFGVIFSSGFLLIALAIVFQGALRDGITDWVPTFISETFSLQSSNAILKSVLLPVLGVISLKVVGIINNKLVREETKGAGWIFALGLVCCTVLVFFYSSNQYITLLVSSIAVGTMHGVNFFLVCIVPARFEKYGMVSTMSGIINSLTYVGSAAAIYIFGAVSESLGWNAVVITWTVTAVLGTLCCFLAVKPWHKFVRG